MAKKKTKSKKDEGRKVEITKVKTEYDDPISNQINEEIAKIVSEGNEILAQLQDLEIISVSPALDDHLGGGIREGTTWIISGPPKVGKSVAALTFAAQCQRKHNKNVYYFDTEARLTQYHLQGIQNLDIDNFKVITPTLEQPDITAEMYLDAAERLVRFVPNLVLIIDSTDNMVPTEELEGKIRTGIRPGLPKLLGHFLKRTSGDVARRGAILVFITHKISNTGASHPNAPKTVSTGGNKLKFQASTMTDITGRKFWKTGKDDSGDEIGQEMFWHVLTSSCGGSPGAKFSGWLRYGVGIDKNKEMLDLAVDLGIVKKGGAWYTLSPVVENITDKRVQQLLKDNEVDPEDTEQAEKLVKFQGVVPTVEWLDKHPEIADLIYEQVQSIPI